MLFLHHAPMSPCVQKVRLALEEKALTWTGKLYDLQAKEQLAPTYLKVNPAGLVPALIDDGHVITDSTVICEYLEDRFADAPPLRPRAASDKAAMRQWLKRVDDILHPNTGALVFSAFVRNRFLSKTPEQLKDLLAKVPDPARRERQRRLIELGLDAPDVDTSLKAYARVFASAQARLQGAEWLAGETCSLADIALLPYAFVCKYLQIECLFTANPDVRRWYEQMIQRPSFHPAISAFVRPGELAEINAAAAIVGPQFCARVAA